MTQQNPFESLRRPGVFGSVENRSFATDLIYQQSEEFLTIRTAEIEPGKWAFGFHLRFGGTTRQMFPGEGSGWFRTNTDAILYGLGHIRTHARQYLRESDLLAIDRAIDRYRQPPSLFD